MWYPGKTPLSDIVCKHVLSGCELPGFVSFEEHVFFILLNCNRLTIFRSSCMFCVASTAKLRSRRLLTCMFVLEFVVLALTLGLSSVQNWVFVTCEIGLTFSEVISCWKGSRLPPTPQAA